MPIFNLSVQSLLKRDPSGVCHHKNCFSDLFAVEGDIFCPKAVNLGLLQVQLSLMIEITAHQSMKYVGRGDQMRKGAKAGGEGEKGS